MHDWLRDDIPCGHGPEGNRRGACIAFYGGPPLRMCACGSPPALLAEAVEDRDDPSPLVEEDDDVDVEVVGRAHPVVLRTRAPDHRAGQLCISLRCGRAAQGEGRRVGRVGRGRAAWRRAPRPRCC